MNKISRYIPSLIISVLLVFFLLGTTAVTTADINITGKYCVRLAEANQVHSKIMTGLENNYKEKSNSTGIPADVYTNALNEDYIRKAMDDSIIEGFNALSSGREYSFVPEKNTALEESIDNFFSDYADSIGYEKNEVYESKLASAKSDTYKTVKNYCDVYKFSTMSSHGVLSKLSVIYRHRGPVTGAFLGGIILFVLLLIIVNLRAKKTVLYWTGISALISGVIGIIPSIWLIATRFFDSFTIKQPQVFTAFTSLMYNVTKAFMAVQIACIAVGVVLLVLYAVICGKCKINEKVDEKAL